jgi:hypothetical protein
MMSTLETLPAIDDCIDLYVRIYDRYGTDAFDPEDLSRHLSNRARGADVPADGQPLIRLLHLLVAYGLLARQRDECYRVRCAPDENPDRWRAKTAPRVETLYQRVQRSTNPSGDEPTSDSECETLWHDGEAFVSIRVTDIADLDSARTTIQPTMDEHSECTGVVLRSSGALAAEVQRFADGICESPTTAGGERVFEKEATDLVGEDKNDLEFRLFLRGTA